MIVRNIRDMKVYDKCKDLELVARLKGRVPEEFISNVKEFLEIRSNFRIKPNTEFKLIKVLLGTDILYNTIEDLEKLLTLLCYENRRDSEVVRFTETLIKHTEEMYDMYNNVIFAIDKDVANEDYNRHKLGLIVERYNKLKVLDSEETLGLKDLDMDFNRKFKADIYNCLVELGTLENTGLRFGESKYDFEELLYMAKKEKFEKCVSSDDRFDALYHLSNCLVFNVMKLNSFPVSWETTKGKLLSVYIDLILENIKSYNEIYKTNKIKLN